MKIIEEQDRAKISGFIPDCEKKNVIIRRIYKRKTSQVETKNEFHRTHQLIFPEPTQHQTESLSVH